MLWLVAIGCASRPPAPCAPAGTSALCGDGKLSKKELDEGYELLSELSRRESTVAAPLPTVRRPTVHVVRARGGLDESIVDRILRRSGSAIGSCVGPEDEGAVRLAATVDPEGTLGVEVVQTALSAAVTACVRDQAMALQFPPPVDGVPAMTGRIGLVQISWLHRQVPSSGRTKAHRAGGRRGSERKGSPDGRARKSRFYRYMESSIHVEPREKADDSMELDSPAAVFRTRPGVPGRSRGEE